MVRTSRGGHHHNSFIPLHSTIGSVYCISFHIYPVLSLSPWKHLSPSRHYSLHDKEVWPRDTGGNFRQTLGLDLIYTDALEPNSDDVADT